MFAPLFCVIIRAFLGGWVDLFSVLEQIFCVLEYMVAVMAGLPFFTCSATMSDNFVVGRFHVVLKMNLRVCLEVTL